MVNEFDLEGNEAVLTSFSMPVSLEDVVEPGKDYAAELKAVITEEKFDEITKLVESESALPPVELDVTSFDKEKRAELHKQLKVVFGKKIFNETSGDDTKKSIHVKKSNKNDKERAHAWRWPHEHTYFILHKENIDTLQAISNLAYQLKIKPSHFAYAGTKDKRAITSQWICAKKVEPQKICQAAKKTQGVRVGNFKFHADTLRLGDLKGNRFKIALRSVKGEQEEIAKSLESFRDLGFINYYGMQRFGNCPSIPTFMVGKALLLGDFKLAVELILKERDGEPPYMTKMRKAWAESQDANKALSHLRPTNTCVEARLLHGLAKNGSTNYMQSLLSIPRNMLMLYSHSYQSLLWNQVASKRRELGVEVIEGDLVYTETASGQAEFEVIDEAVPVEDDEAVAEEATVETESKFLAMVRPLTKEDLDAKTYTIFDIVLPLPGFDIK